MLRRKGCDTRRKMYQTKGLAIFVSTAVVLLACATSQAIAQDEYGPSVEVIPEQVMEALKAEGFTEVEFVTIFDHEQGIRTFALPGFTVEEILVDEEKVILPFVGVEFGNAAIIRQTHGGLHNCGETLGGQRPCKNVRNR
jgi:hypothetical protein